MERWPKHAEKTLPDLVVPRHKRVTPAINLESLPFVVYSSRIRLTTRPRPGQSSAEVQ
jgi:hypothetical protein